MVFCQINFGNVVAVVVGVALVGFALFGVPFLFAVVPVALGFADNAHMAVADGLSEEIVRVNINRGILIWQIEGAIWLCCYRESGKLVPADFYSGARAGVFVAAFAKGGLNAIGTETQVIGNLPIGRSDAEGGGFELRAIDESLFGI